jgi:hypothetical protein
MIEIGVLLACALVGWFAVSWVITIVRQQRQPPLILHGDSQQARPEEVRAPSLRELAETWHTVLRVRSDAGVDEVEAAYHLRIAECDGVRFSEGVGSVERREAERERLRIDEAYNFIRTSRGGHQVKRQTRL